MSSREIPEHVSGVRLMTAEARGDEYQSVATLAEAQTLPDYALILEGDYGGQIYVTCPVDLVRCDDIRQLMADVESVQWANPAGCQIFFEHAPVGSHISGGMGGGTIVTGVWCHEEIHAINMVDAIVDVIEGREERLVIPSVERLEVLGRNGDAQAQYFLANRLRKSEPQKAIEWFVMAGQQGHLGAMNWLSCTSKVSPEERVRWLKAIAERSDRDRRVDWARFRLGNAFATGEGAERDLATAANLYKKCCDSRYSARAAIRLGEMYLDGQGIDKDPRLAVMWLTLGCVSRRDLPPHWFTGSPRDEQAKAKELLAGVKKELPSDLVAEAELMAQQYFADEPEP